MKGNRRQKAEKEQRRNNSRLDLMRQTLFFPDTLEVVPKSQGKEATLGIMQPMLCVHKPTFFSPSSQRTVFFSVFYCRLDSLEADPETVFEVNDSYD